jgi:hypothetical protein
VRQGAGRCSEQNRPGQSIRRHLVEIVAKSVREIGRWPLRNLPRDDGGRTTALLTLLACRERPLFGPVVPADVATLRRP